METFLLLFTNLIPLYLIIGLGYLAGKFFEVERKTIGALGVYIFMPVVAFGFIGQIDFKPDYLLLPLIYFVLLTISTFVWLHIARKVYHDASANLLSLCATSGNTGYFGLPLVLALFPPEIVGIYIFIMMGATIYEATVMYYVASRGAFSVKESLIKLAKFPTLYTIVAALSFNFSGAEFSPQFLTYWGYFKGAYVIVGMMIIGVSLSRVKKLILPPRFLTMTFLGKFVMFPAMTAGVIAIDAFWLHLFDVTIYKLLYILAIVPTAANIAAFAAEMNTKPEKAASTILIGTVFALFSIPLMLILFDHVFPAVSP